MAGDDAKRADLAREARAPPRVTECKFRTQPRKDSKLTRGTRAGCLGFSEVTWWMVPYTSFQPPGERPGFLRRPGRFSFGQTHPARQAVLPAGDVCGAGRLGRNYNRRDSGNRNGDRLTFLRGLGRALPRRLQERAHELRRGDQTEISQGPLMMQCACQIAAPSVRASPQNVDRYGRDRRA